MNQAQNPTLKNKTVIITAGNQGGGAVIALRFAASGANVAVIAEKNPLSEKISTDPILEKIITAGGKAIALEVNLSDVNDIQLAVQKTIAHFGGIDIVINNYSIFNFKNSIHTTSDEFHSLMKNIYATFFISQSCIDALKKSENPHVINIAPPLDMSSAIEACQNHLLFSISKYAMSFCTLGMAKEFEPYGIAFNSLWQDRPIATQTLIRNFSDQVVKGSNKPEIYAEATYQIALKPAKTFTGNFCIDETVLREVSIDPSQYAVDSTATPVKDIFLSGVDYDILNLR